MRGLIEQLEVALLGRNPLLAKNLRLGLSPQQIRNDLKCAGIEGFLEPVLALYSWRNGTELQTNLDAVNAGFVPPIVYQLSETERNALLLAGVKRETASRAYHFVEL